MSGKVVFPPAICVVGFHHARGPEIEQWFGVPDGTDPATENDWAFVPFMALSDGAHTSVEDFSYFTLQKKATSDQPATSLFGMSCTRQLDAKELRNRPDDVTRSTVQKSVVILAKSPHVFVGWREKLSMVTRAWFMQRDFTDMEILKEFQENLAASESETEDEADLFLGISLREFIYEFKSQALILFKCCLLQPKMLFFGSKCERLCMTQFALISLIPGLIRRLEDCADPELDSYEKGMIRPSSLRTSERSSLLTYMGLPLQIFGKGSFFGPYTPLQQLDLLADSGTHSFIVGSTNSLLLQQKDRYSDILVNLDDSTLTISSRLLRNALSLTAADRRWIDFLHKTVVSTWDPANPSRPRNHGYLGSEEFIRLQFEEYVLALLATTKYHTYLYTVPHHKRDLSTLDIEGDPALDFGEAWLEAWKSTNNYYIWSKYSDSHLFDIIEPHHPTAGGLSIDDINRRLTQQIQDMHLDERLATSREALSKHLATGQKKVSTAFNTLWADIESRRAAQRSRSRGPEPSQGSEGGPVLSPTGANTLPSPSAFDMTTPEKTPTSATGFFDASALRARAPDLSGAQAAVGAAGQRAGAYISSWGAWASERSKGWTTPISRSESKERHLDAGSANEQRRTSDAAYESVRGSARAPPTIFEAWRKKQAEEDDQAEQQQKSPATTTSPRKGIRRGPSREEIGSDGIGRLDA